MFFLWLSLAGCLPGQAQPENIIKHPLDSAHSPYVLAHRDNPVIWYPWGEEAFQKARQDDKLLIISIGFAACHWCHVMERETFMNTTVADFMNRYFVPVKIDREERPDLDRIYSQAAEILTGNSGWPLNLVALPDGKPFLSGTYFSRTDWLKMLKQTHNLYEKSPERVHQHAMALYQRIGEKKKISVLEEHSFRKSYQQVFQQWRPLLDLNYGGFKQMQKFPWPMAWNYLLQNFYMTGNDQALSAVTRSLNEMLRGGIYDQLGGGFHRYSLDARWRIPHFEKMLYDNAQLVQVLADAYKLTLNPTYARVIRQTMDFIQRELTSPGGGFYASLNAESEGVEGKYYVWTKADIIQNISDPDLDVWMDFYDIKPEGNWKNGQNVLYRPLEESRFLARHQLSPNVWRQILQRINQKLFKIRKGRVLTETDYKILTSWNALMIEGCLAASTALNEDIYYQMALKNAQWLDQHMVKKNGRVYRSYVNDRPYQEGLLSDYAQLAHAYILLYQVNFDIYWLERARMIVDYALVLFNQPDSPLLYDNKDHKLFLSSSELTDQQIPSANATLARTLYLLGNYFNQPAYLQQSASMLHLAGGTAVAGGPTYASWAILLGYQWGPDLEIAITGEHALEKSGWLRQKYLPNALWMGGREENLPLLKNKVVKNQTLIYVCQDKTCKLPVASAEKAWDILKALGYFSESNK
ncbi:MAG: thioredoxin domain-containing protein [Candidatus Cyclobacteriaceae bacterium M3_2C_046]